MMAKGKRYDWTTPEGRAVLDFDVREMLSGVPQSRADLVVLLKVDGKDERAVEAVTASLRRGIRDGWADPLGERAARRYTSAAVAK